MSGDIYRRCGCRDENGKQYRPLPDRASADAKAHACPKLLSDPKHGSWGYAVSGGVDPVTGKRIQPGSPRRRPRRRLAPRRSLRSPAAATRGTRRSRSAPTSSRGWSASMPRGRARRHESTVATSNESSCQGSGVFASPN